MHPDKGNGRVTTLSSMQRSEHRQSNLEGSGHFNSVQTGVHVFILLALLKYEG